MARVITLLFCFSDTDTDTDADSGTPNAPPAISHLTDHRQNSKQNHSRIHWFPISGNHQTKFKIFKIVTKFIIACKSMKKEETLEKKQCIKIKQYKK